jgi:formylmethanofuran dehydrogenase subunit B
MMGLRAIKEKSGLVVVQQPSSAKFDSMPRSAIDSGLAVIVAPAEELPGKIVAYLRHVPFIVSDAPGSESARARQTRVSRRRQDRGTGAGTQPAQ